MEGNEEAADVIQKALQEREHAKLEEYTRNPRLYIHIYIYIYIYI